MVKLQLIYSKNYFQTKVYRTVILIVFFLSIFLLGPRGRESGFLDDLNLFDEFGFPITIVMVGSGILLVWSYWFSRRVKKLGSLILRYDSVEIDMPEQKMTVSINEIENLKIIHNSFVGKDYEKSILNNYTGDNWLEFSHEGKEYRFEFKVDRPYKSKQLEGFVNRLKPKGLV